MDPYLIQRLQQRKELTRISFWDLKDESSDSEEDSEPRKKSKPIENAEPLNNINEVPIEEQLEEPNVVVWGVDRSKEIRPTFREECKQVDPNILEKLGYVNRNCRPPSSKRKEILTSADDKKAGHSISIEEKKQKEKNKIQEIKNLLQHKLKNNP
ncbi:unnamed protein product [Blepharisma stoltei]|uniref:Uncharacterized protein n=1 Tax=Blepharisma stoltei TaxID=1481888 RepID=A0AAU9IDM3_9CILI|nr:unnamed protein product [Blepharisma stoltei]